MAGDLDRLKKKKKPFDQERFMKSIAHVESGDGKYMINPTSSATGLYGQLYNSIDKNWLKENGVTSRAQFAKDTSLQNAYMRKRISGDMSKTGRKTNLYKDATDLEEEYAPQIEGFDYRPDEIAAKSHFLGRQGVRKYYGHTLRDKTPEKFSVPGVNKTPEEYLELYNEAYKEHDTTFPTRDSLGVPELKQGGDMKTKNLKWASKRRKLGIGGQMPEVPEEAYGTPIEEPAAISGQGAGLLSGVASGASMGSVAGPYGAIAGAILGGVKSAVDSSKMAKATSHKNDLLQRQGNSAAYLNEEPNTGYLEAEYGTDLSDSVDMTEYNGNPHEQGGIPLDGLGVEVEDGETRIDDMVYSDNIVVTKELVDARPKAFKMGDIGKTMAQVSKRVKKSFDRRKYDEWNDTAAHATILALEDVSRELSTIDNQNADAMNYPEAENGVDLMGYAPMVGSGIGLAESLISKAEHVNYPEVGYKSAKTHLRSVDPARKRISQIFGNAEKNIGRYNPSGYLARRANLASQEAGAVTQAAGQVEASNQDALNRTSTVNAQLGSRAKSQSAAYGVQEEESNAANRGAKRSASQAYLANLTTQGGQYSRDKKLMAEQSRKNTILQNYLKDKQSLYAEPDEALAPSTGSMLVDEPMLQDTQAEEDLFADSIELEDPFDYTLESGGSVAKRLGLRNYKTF